MIYTKRFICILISICIIISSICCFSFADYINNIELVGDTFYSLGKLVIKNNSQQNLVDIHQFLPILDNSGLPYIAKDTQQIRFDELELNCGTIFGYYSIYLVLDFYCELSSLTVQYGDMIAWFKTIGISDSYQTVYPEVEIGQKPDASQYDGYNYRFSAYLKWDIESFDSEESFYLDPAHKGGFFLLNSTSANWIISPSNFCLFKYKDFTEFNTLSSINSSVNSIRLNAINISNYTSQLNNFVKNNFGVNNSTPNSVWWLLKGLYDNLASSSNTDSIWYRLITTVGTIANMFRYNTSMDSVSILRELPNGFFDFCINIFKSINDYNIWEYEQQQKTINSTEYQAGQSIQDNISNSDGYGSLSGFSSNASGFGNIGLIGTIFNGLTSAFRWFTNDTKNNIDNVPVNRDVNETISHYLDDNLNLIQEYLTTEADPYD